MAGSQGNSMHEIALSVLLVASCSALSAQRVGFGAWTLAQQANFNAANGIIAAAINFYGVESAQGQVLLASLNALHEAAVGTTSSNGTVVERLFTEPMAAMGGATGFTRPEAQVNGEVVYSAEVGAGSEDTTLATETLTIGDYSLAALMAHEGRRLIQTYKPDGVKEHSPYEEWQLYTLNVAAWYHDFSLLVAHRQILINNGADVGWQLNREITIALNQINLWIKEARKLF